MTISINRSCEANQLAINHKPGNSPIGIIATLVGQDVAEQHSFLEAAAGGDFVDSDRN